MLLLRFRLSDQVGIEGFDLNDDGVNGCADFGDFRSSLEKLEPFLYMSV